MFLSNHYLDDPLFVWIRQWGIMMAEWGVIMAALHLLAITILNLSSGQTPRAFQTSQAGSTDTNCSYNHMAEYYLWILEKNQAFGNLEKLEIRPLWFCHELYLTFLAFFCSRRLFFLSDFPYSPLVSRVNVNDDDDVDDDDVDDDDMDPWALAIPQSVYFHILANYWLKPECHEIVLDNSIK